MWVWLGVCQSRALILDAGRREWDRQIQVDLSVASHEDAGLKRALADHGLAESFNKDTPGRIVAMARVRPAFTYVAGAVLKVMLMC